VLKLDVIVAATTLRSWFPILASICAGRDAAKR